MNENTTVCLHIGRLVIDAGTPLPPGGIAGLQAALEAAIGAALSATPPTHADTLPPRPPALTGHEPMVRAVASAVAAQLPLGTPPGRAP